MAAGVDARERLQIRGDIQRESMITRSAAHSDADTRDFAFLNIHPGRARPRSGRNSVISETGDDGFFECGDEIAHTKTRTTQIDQRIDDELTRSVIGDLSAAINAHHRNFARRKHMSRIGIHAKRKDGLVFEHPDFIGRVDRALIGEALHRFPNRQIGDAA